MTPELRPCIFHSQSRLSPTVTSNPRDLGLSIGAIFDSSLPNPQDEPPVLSIIRSISNVSFLDPQDDPPDDPQDEPSGGLSSTLVQKLPQFKTSKPARPDGSECVVCLDGFRKGRWCRRLPGCGHVFHRKCVDTWFLRADTCPTCRASVRLTE
ncbi:hypothetical protein IGI04_033899 [Brassica rapa subsp. trilocularis]|uniref:RING-type E3 ubiquitin transferase n=1 Tax=Brassica rapa subsp. trilocularis TaxID=1813537 RepID=A0ABQ7L756_BRACM|nr:hypothetical protein IGI04_033899 [Brassica rapa subsp. trilocularis]